MNVFTLLIVVMIPWVHTQINTDQIVKFKNMQFVYGNYNSIKFVLVLLSLILVIDDILITMLSPVPYFPKKKKFVNFM